MAETTIKKNQTAEIPSKNGKNYSYQYVDIAQIHEYLEQNGYSYYQYVEIINDKDYIMTVPIIDEKEQPARRGVRIVDATLYGNDNPAQKQGSAVTYARRYSLLMAFGLATEDDDGQALTHKNTPNKQTEILTLEQAKAVKIKFGKYKDETLGNLVNKDPQYCDWLFNNEKTDISIKKALKMILVSAQKPKTENKTQQKEEDSEEVMMSADYYSELDIGDR